MDVRGRCLGSVFIKRVLRSLTYEAVSLRALADGFEAERVVAEWTRFYNCVLPQETLLGRFNASG